MTTWSGDVHPILTHPLRCSVGDQKGVSWSDMVDVPGKIRRWHLRDGLSTRQIIKKTSLSRNTVRKYFREASVEPDYPLGDRRASSVLTMPDSRSG
jgi:hypothetical protein